ATRRGAVPDHVIGVAGVDRAARGRHRDVAARTRRVRAAHGAEQDSGADQGAEHGPAPAHLPHATDARWLIPRPRAPDESGISAPDRRPRARPYIQYGLRPASLTGLIPEFPGITRPRNQPSSGPTR